MKQNRFLALLLAAALLFAGLSAGCGKKPAEPETAPEESASETESETAAPVSRNPLTGADGYDERYRGLKPIGVVVENSPQARPQWGMCTPDVIMEYEVEGGITRMLWLYANRDELPAQIGPVRSARHDVVELALGMNALFIHCGGSPQALNKIAALGGALTEIEAASFDDCFARDTTRDVATEHTLVLLSEKLPAAMEKLGLDLTADPDREAMFAFADGNAPRTLTGGDAGALHVAYSSPYQYDFTYDEAQGKYLAALNEKPVADDTGAAAAYTNVLVLYTETVDLHDKDGHLDLLLEAGGTGLYLNGGLYERILWEKEEDAAPLRLLTEAGEPLTLNPGNSYIGFVRSTNEDKTTIS